MPKKQSFYAVRVGRQTGVFLTWDDCQEQILGFQGAKFKAFSNAAEAEAFVAGELGTGASLAKSSEVYQSKGKKRAVPGDLEDESGWDVVYSDGACKGNGKAGSVAGIGVWWGKNDPRNMAERCPGDQTNNRAELIAIIRILETVPKSKTPLLIKTDSKYSIDCFQSWLPKWRRNGFKTATGTPVKNAGVIRYLSAHLDARALYGQQIKLQYVKGHSGEEGNEGADAQANKGVYLPTVPERDWETLELELREQIVAEREGRLDNQLTVPMEVEADSLPTGNVMKARKVSAEGTPSAPSGRIGSPSKTKAVLTEDFDSSSAPTPNAPEPAIESKVAEAPSAFKPATTRPPNTSPSRNRTSTTQSIIAALRSPSKAKPAQDRSGSSSKISSVVRSMFPSKSTSSEQTSASPSKVASSPTKTKTWSRIPQLRSPSKTVYSKDPPASSSSLKAQPTEAEESQTSQPTQSTTAESFATALTTIVTTPVDSPSIEESAPAPQPVHPPLPQQSPEDNAPKSPPRIVVDKEDVDFSMYVDCVVDDDDLWKDLYP